MDEKTVLLQLDTALVNGESYKVDAKDVVGTNYTKIPEYKGTTQIFSDTTAPTLVKAALTSTKALKLTFNEPVANTVTVKVDGITVAGPHTASTDAGVYTVTTPAITDAELLKAGTHNVTVYSATDASSNTSAILTGSYTVTADTTAPAVSGLSADSQNSFKIKFSEPISGLTASNLVVKKGSYTFPSAAITSVQLDGTDVTNTTYVVTLNGSYDLNNPLYGAGESSATLAVTVKGYKDNSNLFGNQFDGTVTVSKDTTAPVVQSANLNTVDVAGSKLVIIFNEKLSSATAGKIRVVKDGVIQNVVAAGINGTDAKKLEVTLGSLTAGTYSVTLEAGAVKDLAQNSNTATSTTVVYAGNVGTALTLTADNDNSGNNAGVAVGNQQAGILSADTNVITVNYNEEMNDSAIDLANYKLDGAALPAGTTIGFTSTAKSVVKITLPSASVPDSGSKVVTITKNVTAKSGKVVKTTSGADVTLELAGFKDNVAPELQSGKFVLSNINDATTSQIKLTFSEKMAGTGDTNDFVVTANGTKVNVLEVIDGTAQDRELTIKLANPVNVNQEIIVKAVAESASGTNTTMAVTDLALNKLVGDKSVTIVEKDAPQNTGEALGNIIVGGVSAADKTGTGNDGKVTVSWTALTSAQVAQTAANGYEIFYAETADLAGAALTKDTSSSIATKVTVSGASTATKDIDSLTAGTEYTFVVYAVDASGNYSAVSSEVTATPENFVAATSGSAVGSVAFANDTALATATTAEDGNDLVVTVDGTDKTLTIDATVTTKAGFLTALNTALGSAATASFDASNKLKVVSATTGEDSTVTVSGDAADTFFGTATEVAGEEAAN